MPIIPHKQPKPGPKPAKKTTQKTPVIGDLGGLHSDLGMGLSGIEVELGNLARAVKSIAGNAAIGENSLNLFTGVHSHPVRLVLEGEAVDKIADALSRIADALAAKG
jgi:hypothetical protein